MTGMYQTTIGAHNHRSHRDDGYQLPAGRRGDHRLAARRRLLHGQRPAPSQAAVGFAGTGKTDWNFTSDGEAVRLATAGPT